MAFHNLRPRPITAVFLLSMWIVGGNAAHAVDRRLEISAFPFSFDAIQVPITTSFDAGTPLVVNTVYVTMRPEGTNVIMTAPKRFMNRNFVAWWKDGPNEFSLERTIEVTLDANVVYIAAYGFETYQLKVSSSPDSGITFLNEDIEELETPYERYFELGENYEAIINAPVMHNGKPFARWLLDGKEASKLHVINIIMDQDHDLEAQYGTGSIRCTIQPRAARKAKAKWRIDGGPWLKKNTVVEGLLVGTHKIEWKPVPGFITPNPRNVPVEDGDVLTIRGRYFTNEK